jgi:chromate transporter
MVTIFFSHFQHLLRGQHNLQPPHSATMALMVLRQSGEKIPPNSTSRPRLIEIVSVFARYGNLTFGGGSATIGVLQREIETKRPWITRDQFRLCYGLSRLTPGTNLLAFCTAVGWLTRGWPGAAVALVAASLPCSLVAVAVTALFELWTRNPWAKVALHGALAAAVGIIFYTCWHLTRSNLRRSNWVRLACVLAAFIMLQSVFALAPIRVLLVAAAVGAIWPKESNS